MQGLPGYKGEKVYLFLVSLNALGHSRFFSFLYKTFWGIVKLHNTLECRNFSIFPPSTFYIGLTGWSRWSWPKGSEGETGVVLSAVKSGDVDFWCPTVHCAVFQGTMGLPGMLGQKVRKLVLIRIPAKYPLGTFINTFMWSLFRVKWAQKESLAFQEAEDPLGNQEKEANKWGISTGYW